MAHAVDVHVGMRIRQARWTRATSQAELAERIGIRFQQVQRYETGANRVSASRLWDIAKALDVPISFFFEGLGAEIVGRASAEPEELFDREALKMIHAYYAIPEAFRRRLFDLARVLAAAA